MKQMMHNTIHTLPEYKSTEINFLNLGITLILKPESLQNFI